MDWLPLTLLCAFFLASSDAATKAWLGAYSAREILLVRFTLAGLLVSPILLLEASLPPMVPEFWGWLAVLLPLEVLAMLLYMQAIRDHALALTLPYLSFTPVLVVLSGWLLLGESISARGFEGILLVVAGAWLLNSGHAQLRDWRSWGEPLRAILYHRGSRLMLAVAAIYSLTSVMGKGAMQYMPPEQFGAFYTLLLGVTAPLLVGATQGASLAALWRRPWANLAVAAGMGAMMVTHFLALQQVEVAYMISVKRTSLLFGILYGALVFREVGLGRNLFAAGVMLGGVLLVSL